MRVRAVRIAAVAVTATVGLFVAAGAARAVSGGGYSPDQQSCPDNSSNSGSPSDPSATPKGCHNFALNVESGGTNNGAANSDNTRYAEVGIDQSPNIDHNPGFGGLENVGDPGTPASPHSGCFAANTDGTNGGTGTGCGDNPNGAGASGSVDYYQVYCPATNGLPLDSVSTPKGTPALKNCSSNQPVNNTTVNPDTGTGQRVGDIVTKGAVAYLGADDNLDNGEHDGFTGAPGTNTGGAVNGPSDGGAVTISATPQTATNTPTGHNPQGAANASVGMCADGICAEATTQQQTVYHGCGATTTPDPSADQCAPGTPSNGNVYENGAPSSTQESKKCSSGGTDNGGSACYTNADGTTSNPNGPDGYRQNTPNNMNAQPGVQTYQDPDPQRSPAAPVGTPGLYVGTCGVYANDGGSTVGPGVTGQNPGYVVKGAC